MNKLTCFLVDDDLDDREIFCTVLEGILPNSTCFTAANGQAALEMLLKGEFIPQIIFLDLNMPLMNGRQFLLELKNRNVFLDIPIVVLTTSADLKTKAAVLQLGAEDFITKPDKFSEWENILTQVVTKFLK